MKVVFMGTPVFALPTLKALISSEHKVVAVYTQPPRPAGRGQKETPSPVHQFALEKNIPAYTPVSLKTPEAQAQFASHNADIAVVVAYGLLLPKTILGAYPRGCINVHPSKLPRWRGAAPIQRTIMAGDKETAICIMQMDEGLDTGDILLQKNFAITDGTTAGALHDWLAEEAAPLVLDVLKNNPPPLKQQNTGVEYANKITKEECRIDWSKPAETIYYQILGLSPIPGASFEHKGEIIKIFNAHYSKTNSEDGKYSIPCNPGRIYPTELQRPGKKRMTVNEFMLGFKP
jgi:methionyl-tRNA formyltransferase